MSILLYCMQSEAMLFDSLREYILNGKQHFVMLLPAMKNDWKKVFSAVESLSFCGWFTTCWEFSILCFKSLL